MYISLVVIWWDVTVILVKNSIFHNCKIIWLWKLFYKKKITFIKASAFPPNFIILQFDINWLWKKPWKSDNKFYFQICLVSFTLKWKMVKGSFPSGLSGYNYIQGDLDFAAEFYLFIKLKRHFLFSRAIYSLAEVKFKKIK